MRARFKQSGFTLVEMLVSTAILILMVGMLSQVLNGLRIVLTRTSNQIEQFQQARTAFETISRRLGQATLNAYDDVDPNKVTTTNLSSAGYARASELRFLAGNADVGTQPLMGTGDNVHPTQAVFFQAPLGAATSGSYSSLVQLLNTCGYFVEWGSDQYLNTRPPFLPTTTIPYRFRFRLMELIEPSDSLSIYKYTSGAHAFTSGTASASWSYTGMDWFQPLVTPVGTTTRPVHVIADNVVLLSFLPMVAPQNAQNPPGGAADGTSTDIAPNYLYDSSVSANTTPDSHNQLPPEVFVTMIAVDEQSFSRFETISGAGSTNPPNPSATLGLTNILTDASYTKRQADILAVTNALTTNHLTYRIFSAAVPLTRN